MRGWENVTPADLKRLQAHSVSLGSDPVNAPKGRSRYSAVPTTVCGMRFASKAEANGYLILKARCPRCVIYRQVRYPLINISPTKTGIPMWFTLDFVVRHSDPEHLARCVTYHDAKRGTRSREWARGRAAFEACYGVTVEEIEA